MRLGWAAAFTALLLALCAAPVLTASAADSSEAPGQASEALPSSEEFAQALGAAEAENKAAEEAHEEELASPQAQRQREASLAAYLDLTAAEAQSLLSEAFPEALAELNADPARTLSGLQIEKVLGPNVARVSNEEGSSELVESSIPIEVGQGSEREPVDLSLQREGDAFFPQNPLSEVQLPASASGAVRLQDGITISGLPGEGDPSAHRFGEESLFYPNTDASTDTLIAPKTHGVEIFEQLRSPESPEQFRYPLALPQGASLKENAQGGAEVINSSGQVLATIPAPSASDAQGTEVPVSLGVEGDTLVVEIDHSSGEFAYPLLLDPEFRLIFENAGAGGTSLGSWTPAQTGPFPLARSLAGECQFGLCDGSGLYAQAPGNPAQAYGAETFGQWVFQAPGFTGYFRQANFSSIQLTVPGNCAGQPEPHGYVGVFNIASGGFALLEEFHSAIGGGTAGAAFSPDGNLRIAVAGIGTHIAIKPPCTRVFFAGGASFAFEDSDNPLLGTPSGPGGPVANTPRPITVSASDQGFGVFSISVQATGSDGQTKTWTTLAQPGCTGLRSSECPHSVSNQSVTYEPSLLPEGSDTLTLTAFDAAGSPSAPQFVTVTVDRTPPDTVIDTGPANESSIAATSASYTYHSSESGASFECKVDSGAFASCPASGFTTPTMAGGEHHFSVRSTDQAGNTDPSPATRTLFVGAPDTVIDTGPSGLTKSKSPFFTYHATFPGSTFSCSIDGTAFAGCPASGFRAPALSDGSHTFAVKATSSAGVPDASPASRSFSVAATPPSVQIESGPSGLINNPTPTFTFRASAGATLGCSFEAESAQLEEPSFSPCSSASSETPAAPLPDAPYTFIVRATDAAGNEATDARAFTLDTTPPDTTISSGAAGTTDDPKPTFAFFSSQHGSSFKCRYDSEAFRSCSGPGGTDIPTAALSEGAHTFEVRATDPAGNTDPTPAARSFSLNTSGPQTTIESPSRGSVTTTNPTFQYSADESSSFQCRVDGASFASCPQGSFATSGLSEGEHSFDVRAINGASLIDPTPASQNFIIDTSLPSLPAVGGPLREAGAGGLILRIELHDGNASSPATIRSGVKAISLFIDGRLARHEEVSCNHPLGACPDTEVRNLQLNPSEVLGNHTYKVQSEDVLGHVSALAEWSKNTSAGLALTPKTPGPVKASECPAGLNKITKPASPGVMRGTICDDLIIAPRGIKKIIGNKGNDVIIGGASEEQIHGGEGNDTIRAGHSNDVVHGEGDNDLIYGGVGDDRLFGEGGNDLLDGGPGADIERGEEGADTIRGGQGEDQLSGGKSKGDVLSFADAISPGFSGGGASGFPGTEPGVKVNLNSSLPTAEDGPVGAGGGKDALYIEKEKQHSEGPGVAEAKEAGEFERIIGSPFEDLIERGSGEEEVEAGPGTDVVLGAGASESGTGAHDAAKIELGIQGKNEGVETDLGLDPTNVVTQGRVN